MIRRMRRTNGLRRMLREESGQAAAEYASTTFILLAGGLGLSASWPFTKLLFEGLQGYIDLYFYALNLALG